MEKIKKTKYFTELGWKTTATLVQERYSIEEAVRIGERIEAIGQLLSVKNTTTTTKL